MNDTVFFLSTCDTCKRILNEIDLPESIIKQDIKKQPLTLGQLKQLKTMVGSFEILFSRRAQLYRQRGLKDKQLSETDYKNLLLEHYTFLKRPVFVIDNQVFVGNSKKNIEALKTVLKDF